MFIKMQPPLKSKYPIYNDINMPKRGKLAKHNIKSDIFSHPLTQPLPTHQEISQGGVL